MMSLHVELEACEGQETENEPRMTASRPLLKATNAALEEPQDSIAGERPRASSQALTGQALQLRYLAR